MQPNISFSRAKQVIENAAAAENQEWLCGYLKQYNLPVGWLLSFCFNTKKEKLTGTHTIEMDGKMFRETVV
ncbi:MAG: hypothetical protein LUG93_05515 [Lachnospiraceae bacterium]|nr:hypothetical protein [Lachnospiraceae bacterium]